MARPREFQEEQVVALATELFARLGFNGTSIDDLLLVTNLKRGSLYKAFGSKRNLFEICLKACLQPDAALSTLAQDLLIVALKEIAPNDPAIKSICQEQLARSGEAELSLLLGNRLLQNIKES